MPGTALGAGGSSRVGRRVRPDSVFGPDPRDHAAPWSQPAGRPFCDWLGGRSLPARAAAGRSRFAAADAGGAPRASARRPADRPSSRSSADSGAWPDNGDRTRSAGTVAIPGDAVAFAVYDVPRPREGRSREARARGGYQPPRAHSSSMDEVPRARRPGHRAGPDRRQEVSSAVVGRGWARRPGPHRYRAIRPTAAEGST